MSGNNSRRRVLLLGTAVALLGWKLGWASQPLDPRPPLKVRIYSSLTPGIKERHAIAFTRPMVDLLSERVGYPIKLGFVSGDGLADLLALGAKLSTGELHLAAVWGIESGWLRAAFPQLTSMAVTSAANRIAFRSRLMVRRGAVMGDPRTLKGRTLATFDRAPLMDTLFLHDVIASLGEDHSAFFGKTISLPTPKEAIWAVQDKKADCLVVNIVTFGHFIAAHPAVKDELVPIAESLDFPEPVLLGVPANIAKLRPDLWTALQRDLSLIHDTSEGKECVQFWRFDSFILPDNEFEGKLKLALRAFPSPALRK